VLIIFVNLLAAETYGPETVSGALAARMYTDCGDDTSATVDLPWLEKDESYDAPRYNAMYAVDLIGDTDEQANTYRDNFEEAVGQLSDKPDETAVAFDMQPDAICASCTFGHHCKRTLAYDVATIETLTWVGEDLGVADQIEVIGDREDSSLRLVTTPGIVRRMMRLFKDAGPADPVEAFKLSRDNIFYEPFKIAAAFGHDYAYFRRT
jgi:hypothetical protein